MKVRVFEALRSRLGNGAVLFTLSNVLPSLLAIGMGPLILAKVGLEEYGLLGLAAYFLSLATTYSDFGAYVHLISAFSDQAAPKRRILTSVFLFKFFVLLVFYAVLIAAAIQLPRKDALYALIGIGFLGVLSSPMNVDWYFIARQRYRQLFWGRIALNGLQAALILAWYFSNSEDSRFVPAIAVISGAAGTLSLVGLLGSPILRFKEIFLRRFSLRDVGALILRLAPIGATQIITPYFLAYSMVWFYLCSSDAKLAGAFSISYRVVMGFSSLLGPFVLYFMAGSAQGRATPFRKVFGASAVAVAAFWLLGAPVVWMFFRLGKADPALLGYSLRCFSILLLGLFLVALRTLYVSRCLTSGRYLHYFLIHAASCLPVLFFSWAAGSRLHSDWVPWLACIPDLLATSGFAWYFHSRFAPANVPAGDNA